MLNSRPQILHFLLSSLALTSLVFAGACVSSAGTSNPRVVVMPISGSDSAEEALTHAVDRRYELVSERRYARAAKKLDAKSQRSKDIRRVSRKLDIDAVVVGKLVKKGRKKYELRLVLRAGESGKKFDSIKVRLRSKRLKKKDVRKVRKKLYSALSVVESWETSVDDDDDDDRSTRSRRSRGSSDSSKREMERARKLRARKHEQSRRDDERRSERDEKRRREKEDADERRERKRAEKDRRRAKKDRRRSESMERKRRDRDDDDRSRSSRKSKDSKKSRKRKKKKKKEETVEVITIRDDSGQAIDDEDPF